MDPSTYGSSITADTSTGLSNNLWQQGGGCPRDQIRNGYTRGIYFHNDYTHVGFIGTQTTEIAVGDDGLKVYNAGAGTVVSKSTINSVEYAGGFLWPSFYPTITMSAHFAQSYPNFLLTGNESNSGKLWFEHRMCFTPIVTNGIGWILGLAEVELWALGAAIPLNAGDAVTNSAGFIGFNKLEDGLGVINTCKADRAAAAPTSIQAAVGSVAGFEFVKLGMFYDPSSSAECLTFYVNGIKCSTVVSKATLQAYTYIDANALGFIFASVADSAGTSGESFHDWTCIYQLVP